MEVLETHMKHANLHHTINTESRHNCGKSKMQVQPQSANIQLLEAIIVLLCDKTRSQLVKHSSDRMQFTPDKWPIGPFQIV